MNLFEDKERLNTAPYDGSISIYNFYDENCQTKITEIRNLLNSWFDKYPIDSKLSLKQKFKNDFNGALYELYIYIIFSKQGFKLIPEPIIPNSKKTPDYLAIKGRNKFYIEVTNTDGKSDKERKKENFENNFKNFVNKFNSPNFWFYLSKLQFKSDKLPKIKSVKKGIEEKLSKSPTGSFPIKDFKTIFYIYYKDEDVEMKIGLIPKSKKAREISSSRNIGIEIFGHSITTDVERALIFQRPIKIKASKYKDANLPLLVCVNYIGNICNIEDDVDYTLLGETIYNIPPDYVKTRGIYNRIPLMYTSLSATMFTKVTSGNLLETNHRLIINPNAKNLLHGEDLLLTHEVIENNKFKPYLKLSIAELFKTRI